jgi:hypothetical protein
MGIALAVTVRETQTGTAKVEMNSLPSKPGFTRRIHGESASDLLALFSSRNPHHETMHSPHSRKSSNHQASSQYQQEFHRLILSDSLMHGIRGVGAPE